MLPAGWALMGPWCSLCLLRMPFVPIAQAAHRSATCRALRSQWACSPPCLSLSQRPLRAPQPRWAPSLPSVFPTGNASTSGATSVSASVAASVSASAAYASSTAASTGVAPDTAFTSGRHPIRPSPHRAQRAPRLQLLASLLCARFARMKSYTCAHATMAAFSLTGSWLCMRFFVGACVRARKSF